MAFSNDDNAAHPLRAEVVKVGTDYRRTRGFGCFDQFYLNGRRIVQVFLRTAIELG